MKTTLLLCLCLGFASKCAAEELLATYDWRELADTGRLRGGVPVRLDGKSAVQITNTNDTALQVQLLEIQQPPIQRRLYAVLGQVKYESVQGDGYLEMWNYFPPIKPGLPEAQYFGRTLGTSGAMGKITGTSNWRAFMLPSSRCP